MLFNVFHLSQMKLCLIYKQQTGQSIRVSNIRIRSKPRSFNPFKSKGLMHPECFMLLVSLITYMVRLDCQSYGNVRQPSQISAFGVVVLILTTLNLGSEGRAIRQSRPMTCTLDKTKTFIRKGFVGSSLGTCLKRFFVSLLCSYLRNVSS